MMYSAGNTAKQWILEQLSERFADSPAFILDLACGTGWIWESFLTAHQGVRVTGVDFDKRAITEGRKHYQGHARIDLRIGDAQRPVEEEAYDAVIALSAIEHVVDRPAFLQTVFRALKRGGIAYLNYDAGHFRSSNLRERLMVPVSQALAVIGIQGPYMKKVDDALFCAQAEHAGFRVLGLRKHNLAVLKGIMRGAPEETIRSWYELEEALGKSASLDALDPIMLSTTVVLEKV